MSCDDCLSRRAFLTKSSLAVAGVAALTAGCGDGQIGGFATTAPIVTGLTLKVSTVPALATVGQLVLHPTDARIARGWSRCSTATRWANGKATRW
jgi:hypothetical protein